MVRKIEDQKERNVEILVHWVRDTAQTLIKINKC
jgi:hypothetical protein